MTNCLYYCVLVVYSATSNYSRIRSLLWNLFILPLALFNEWEVLHGSYSAITDMKLTEKNLSAHLSPITPAHSTTSTTLSHSTTSATLPHSTASFHHIRNSVSFLRNCLSVSSHRLHSWPHCTVSATPPHCTTSICLPHLLAVLLPITTLCPRCGPTDQQLDQSGSQLMLEMSGMSGLSGRNTAVDAVIPTLAIPVT